MSIFNDPRRYSEDPEEYLEWKLEVARESRQDEYEPDEDLVIDLSREEGVENE